MSWLGVIHQISFVIFVTIVAKEFSHALSDVRVKVPHAVRRGERAILKCYYNIEDDSLYSVKWYKGRREFYRYTPKENPAMKIFQFPGVKVGRFASNESQLVLESVTMATSGKYSCEVSADAPSFHTLIAAGELEVVDTPHNAPYITGVRQRYRIGDILRGNCTSRHSRPAANLTWTVNNEVVNPSHVRHFKILRDGRNDMETSIMSIHFLVTDQHFDEHGKLKLRCTANIHDIYWKGTEKTIIEMDRYHEQGEGLDSINNIIQTDEEPYDQYAVQDGEMLRKKDSYLTQLQDFFLKFVPSSPGSSDTSIAYDESSAWSSRATSSTAYAGSTVLAVTLCCCLVVLQVGSSSSYVGVNSTAIDTRPRARRIEDPEEQQLMEPQPKAANKCCMKQLWLNT